MKTDFIVKAIGAVVLLVAVAAAGFYGGTFMSREQVGEETPVTNGARPRSPMAARLAALPHVTDVIEGRRRDETIYYVVLDAAGGDEIEAFLAALDQALAGDRARDRIVLVQREGGRVLRWHLEDDPAEERAP